MFIKTLKFELRNMLSRNEFYIALLIGIIFSSSSFLFNCASLFGKDIRQIYPANQLFFGFPRISSPIDKSFYFFALPLIASMSYGDSFFTDWSLAVQNFILTRTKRNFYILSKALIAMFSGFVVIFIPLMINLLLTFTIGPLRSNINFSNQPSYEPLNTSHLVFENLYWLNPYIYNLLYTIIPAIAGSLVALLSLTISMLIKKSRLLIVSLPLILYVVYGFIVDLLGKANFRLDAYLLSRTSMGNLSFQYLVYILGAAFGTSIILIFLRNFIVKEEL